MKPIKFAGIFLCVNAMILAAFIPVHNAATLCQPACKAPAENTIGEIHLPKGFERITVAKGSFGEWLRDFHLKKDNVVRLYNGTPKERQDLHYAVLDLSTGSKDLQQCADAVMRLQAEYYFGKKEYTNIAFPQGDGRMLRFDVYAREHGNCYTHECLLHFMEKVFAWCGTYTVADITKPVPLQEMQPGDVFVKAGSPGHAMIVADVAENKATNQRIYLLAQSYMPAQDMHIVINPNDNSLSPWYAVNDGAKIITPGWIFDAGQLRRWM